MLLKENKERKEKMKSNTLVKALFTIAIVAFLLSSSLLISPVSPSLQRPTLKEQRTGSLTLPEHEWVDGTHTKYMESKKEAAQASSSMGISILSVPVPPTDMEINVSDFYLNVDYEQNFHLVLTGTHCYVYAALDLVAPILNYYDSLTDEYVFVNPNYPGGGWTDRDRISTAQLTYLMNEFDNTIYPIMTTTFGTPTQRPADEDKIYILIMNIRCESYYNSGVNVYVAGYFSWGEDSQYDKNMIHIDSFDWANRIGPGVARPYLYEGTFAHEFEHLIHNDIDAGEESWIDEGCADFAQYVCGYGHDAGHIAYYLLYHPWTSLTFFGGGLESYGASYLFILYLYEHFGGIPFIVDLVYNPLHSIDGVVDTLQDHGYTISFEQLFHNWAIANYIDDTSIGNGEYGYYTLDIPSRDTWGYSIQYGLWNWWIGFEFWRGFGYQASWWPGMPQPYTAHYWEYAFTPTADVNFLYGGDAISGVAAHSGSYHWYGGMGNWVWRKLSQSFLSIPAGAKLKFWTSYDIEHDWDYAYVEVHDITAGTWTTLPGVYTTTTLPHEQDNPNVPAGREPKDYFHAGTWNALTGNSGGYYQEIMDLAPFAGHDIELNFVYWTDGAANGMGIFIDDIEITGLGFFDDVEAGADGWTPGGWIRTTGLFANNWQGSVIDVTGIDNYRDVKFRYRMRWGPQLVNFQPGKLHDVWDITGGLLTIPKSQINVGHLYVAVFWNAVPHLFPGDYWFLSLIHI